MSEKEMLEKVRIFAIEAHEKVNHTYGDKPYGFHLQMVVDVAMEFIHLIPEEDRVNLICALWLHDTIEDCRLTFNDISKISNDKVAEIVYALTNEKGRTRKQRANNKYYSDMLKTKYARFAKMCDRVANIQNSKNTGSRMYMVYLGESIPFVKRLFPNKILFLNYQNVFTVRLLNKIFMYFLGQIPIENYERKILKKMVDLFHYDTDNFEMLIVHQKIQKANYAEL